uniref:Uncharacterized protein n=1 Tax=Pithovirus LCPAC406 TaxID=2506599 RepID=A0A481ZHE5_9VIRU|nr:MAG: uncharacterized protein LCPAC406_03430 [Pithovirus LCPAC406]
MLVICDNNINKPGINVKTLDPELLIFLDDRNSELIRKVYKYRIKLQSLNFLKVGPYRILENIVYNEVENYCVEIRDDIIKWRSHPDMIAYVLENKQHKYHLVETYRAKHTVSEIQINGYNLIIISGDHDYYI